MQKRESPARGGTLGISGWGCAAGTLEPLTYRHTGYFLPVGAVNHLPKKFCKLLKFLLNSRTETRADATT